MGCDIHAVLEIKDPTNNKWIGFKTYRTQYRFAYGEEDHPGHGPNEYMWPVILSRNYALFNALAGVRGEGDGPEPRGIPMDASDLAWFEIASWGADGHSHSWGLLDEVGPLFMAHHCPDKVFDEKRKQYMYHLFDVDAHCNEVAPTYRLIYWFDN